MNENFSTIAPGHVKKKKKEDYELHIPFTETE